MITVFNGETIYEGTDVTEYNRICDILSDYKIRYKAHTTGVRRFYGHGVTTDVDTKELYQYSIRVHREDLEKAKRLVAGK